MSISAAASSMASRPTPLNRRPSLVGPSTVLLLALTLLGVRAQAADSPPPLPPAPPSLGTTGTPGPAGTTSTTAARTSTRQIVLELGKRTISLLEDGKVLGSWPVAIGDPATPTPTGSFKVENKVIDPQYQSTKSGKVNATTGANGPLGDRWMGFHRTTKDQYGIHGTPSAWAWAVNTRAAVTHGCVRMLGPHVRQLFNQVEVGTPVIVKR
jgi:lipoprotein-anchoring transpeptidase ErfK/SrfK